MKAININNSIRIYFLDDSTVGVQGVSNEHSKDIFGHSKRTN